MKSTLWIVSLVWMAFWLGTLVPHGDDGKTLRVLALAVQLMSTGVACYVTTL